MFENSGISASVNSIYKTLQESLQTNYSSYIHKDEITNVVDSILKIHGLSKSDFSVIDNIEKIIVNNLNDVSIDDNSNKSDKTINALIGESLHPFRKVVGYRFLYRKLKDLYGKKHAKFLSGFLYDYSLAISDSTKILIPYCWSFDASKLITIGKPFGQLPSKPVQRIDSYISLLNEVIHQMSNHLAGAIAIGTFFLDIAYLLLYKEHKTIDDLKNPEYRKYIENQYQRIVHGFNSLSRSDGIESPFTNISIFDRVKLKELIKEYQLFYLDIIDKVQLQNGAVVTDEYVIDFIVELQNIFMEFFDKGDPINNGLPYRFPIVTINISKNNDKLEDKTFLKYACKKDIYRYNIFVSEGNKIASCCRLYNDNDLLALASQVNSFGAGSSISLGSHRVVTLNLHRYALLSQSYKDFLELVKNYIVYAKQILYAHKQLLYEMKDLQLFVKLGWIQLERMFSTVGLIGYYEAIHYMLQNFTMPYKSYEEVLYNIIEFINLEVNSNNSNFKGCVFNIEQIPGESMAHRLARIDEIIFKDKQKYKLYANQFVPLWDNSVSIFKRMEIDGKCMKLLTGGGITHINTGEHITSKQADNLIRYAVQCGCEHFAITGTFCKCVDNHVVLGNTALCSICGKDIVEKKARVVGFWVNVSDMSIYRKEFDHAQRKEYKNGDFDM